MADDLFEDEDLGPAMRALNEKQRAFVDAYCSFPCASQAKLAEMAGYGNSTIAGLRVRGHRLLQMPSVLLAINEELAKRFKGKGAAISQMVLFKIALNDKHPKQLNAALALADRGGFPQQTEQRVIVEKTDRTGEAMIVRIKALAKMLGIDAQKLLGRGDEVLHARAIIEAEAEVVEADDGRANPGATGDSGQVEREHSPRPGAEGEGQGNGGGNAVHVRGLPDPGPTTGDRSGGTSEPADRGREATGPEGN